MVEALQNMQKKHPLPGSNGRNPLAYKTTVIYRTGESVMSDKPV